MINLSSKMFRSHNRGLNKNNTIYKLNKTDSNLSLIVIEHPRSKIKSHSRKKVKL